MNTVYKHTFAIYGVQTGYIRQSKQTVLYPYAENSASTVGETKPNKLASKIVWTYGYHLTE